MHNQEMAEMWANLLHGYVDRGDGMTWVVVICDDDGERRLSSYYACFLEGVRMSLREIEEKEGT